ncbi:hypothetical protein [Nocardia brevicatena]|uniref:hypothetical protein n=1 Tax=Nocardia brevicatena TaxID=37327 RepID=UPI0005953F2F|nr:hypothetical protein [Nocardia brevicatena]
MDIGQGTATALWQQAVAGSFRMEPEAAEACAGVFQRFAETIESQVQSSGETLRAGGFGGFDSAKQLQKGFRDKGEKLTEALIGLQSAALRMAAAYLRAGQKFEEADSMNSRAVALAAEGLPK